MVGMAEIGVPVSQHGVAVHSDCWCVCLCYLHFAPKNPEDGDQSMIFGYHYRPVGAPACLHKQEVGKPSWNTAQLCGMAQRRVVLMMTYGQMDCGGAGDFGSVPGMLTHLVPAHPGCPGQNP